MKKWLRLLLIATVLTPFPFLTMGMFFNPVVPKILALEGLILIATLFWLYLWYRRYDGYAPTFTLLTFAITSYITVSLVAAIQGVNFWSSFWSSWERMDGIFLWIVLLVFFLILGAVFKKQEDWIWLFRASLLVSILIGLIELNFFSLFGKALPLFLIMPGVFGNPLYLGVYSLTHIAIASLLFYFHSKRFGNNFSLMIRNFWGGFYVVGLVLNCIVLFLTAQRGPILGFLLGLVAMSIWYMFVGSYRALFLKCVSIVLLAFILAFPFWKDSRIVKRINAVRLGSGEDRFINWGIARQAFLARPFLGWGSNNYSVAQNEFYNPRLLSITRKNFDRVHNKYLEVAVDSGILGLATYVSIFSVTFFYLFRTRRREPFLNSLLVGFLVAYLFQNLFLFDNPGSYLPLFLILSFINSELVPSFSFQLKPWSFFVMSCGALVAILLWQGVWQPYRANRELVRALILQGSQVKNYDEIQEHYRKALSYSRVGAYETRMKLGVFVLSQLGLSKRLLDFAIRELERELIISGNEVELTVTLARLYERKGHIEKKAEFIERSEALLKRAIKLSPRLPTSYEHYALFLINQDRWEEARSELLKMRGLNEDIFKSLNDQLLPAFRHSKNDFNALSPKS